MPTDNSRRPSSEPLDPAQTLFFQRRKKTVNFLPLIVVCALVLGSGALAVWALSHTGGSSGTLTRKSTPDPFAGRPILSAQDAQNAGNSPVETMGSAPAPTPVARAGTSPAPAGGFDRAKPVRAAKPIADSVPSSAAGVSLAPGTPNLDINDPDNAAIRAEVLQRIDLMPTVSAANKDKLYASVDHARGMGRVLTIPFEKGDTTVRASDIERLKQQLSAPQVKSLVDDPTVVFVVLGYADQKGNEKINSEISLSRARSVLDTLRDKCGFQNVMHAVAMGGSKLFSAQQNEKNRVVEIWAVQP